MPKTRTVQDFNRPKRLPLTDRLCNLDRLVFSMESRNLDGIIITHPLNIFYLTSFNGVAHKADEPPPYAIVLSRCEPENSALVIADYYISSFLQQPTWIKNIHPFRGVMMPLDLASKNTDIDRFVAANGIGIKWVEEAKKRYRFNMKDALRDAINNLRFEGKRIGFDDMGFGFRLSLDGVKVCDAYDAMMFARAVKTSEEVSLMRRATKLNEEAILLTIESWDKGATWKDIDNLYTHHVTQLGGFVRDPGGMIWGHPRGSDPALMLNAGLDHNEINSGTHVMFDCHGTLELYCWDGGKTWVVDDNLAPKAKSISDATEIVAGEVINLMRPGVTVKELQSRGREVYRKAGVQGYDDVVIFFHGLGLSHMDIETKLADGSSNINWTLEENMIVPLHLLYPGGEKDRIWLEEVVLIKADGGEPLFSWGFSPLTSH